MDFDFNKLYQNSLDNIFTDLELVIEDSIATIRLNVHKIVLICSSEYFHKMLLFDKSKTTQHMYVDNAQIMRDVILSFYGVKNDSNYPKWKYLLETIKCRNYLCLFNDVSLLYDLKVPVDGFELLLEVLELFDVANDRRLLWVIKNNLPDNFDLGNFSNELVSELTKNNLIVSGSDRSIKIWDADSGQLISTLIGHTGEVRSVALSHDNQKIVSGSCDCSIKIWDANSGQLIHTLNEHTNTVRSVAFSHNDEKIVSGSWDHSIKIWDAESGQLIYTLIGHTNEVYSVAFSHDDQLIVSGSADHSIKIWNANNGQLINTLTGHIALVRSVAFSNDSQKIVSSSEDKCIKIWNTNTGQLIHTLRGHTSIVFSVALSYDFQKIISGSADNSIKIWDTQSGYLITTLNLPPSNKYNQVYSVAFLNNNQEIVSGNDDGTIRIWDVNSGQLIHILNGHIGPIWSVACSNS